MSERFSKQTLAKFIGNRIRALGAIYDFDSTNGCAQVENKDKAANRAYGEYMALLDLADAFNLDWTKT